MTNQGKLFKISAISGLAGIVLPVILILVFGHVTDAASTILLVLTAVLLLIAVIAVPIALSAYREQGRKPGSLPLIYSVVAFPLGIILTFISLPTHFPPALMVGLIGLATGVPALIIGLVKKLSVKATPAVMSPISASE